MHTVRDIMTPAPITLPLSATVADAAREMRDADVGDVLVVEGDVLRGLVTDRDIVVRGLATGWTRPPRSASCAAPGSSPCRPTRRRTWPPT